jgi:MFS family permease
MLGTIRNPKLLKIYLIPLISMILGTMTGAISIVYILELGGTVFDINLITTISSAMGILLIVPFGMLSDRLGRRPTVLYPRIIMLVGTTIYAIATTPFHLIIASIIGGFAGGSFFPVLLSMIGDVAQPEERQEAISTFYIFSSIGMFIGPLITSGLLTIPQMTMRTIYQIVTVAQVSFTIYLITQIKETQRKQVDSEKVDYKTVIGQLLKERYFLSIIFLSFLYFFFNSIMNTFIPIFGRLTLQLSTAEIASISTFRSIAVMIIRFSAAAILSKFSDNTVLLSAIFLGGITGISTYFASNYLSIIIIMFLSGLSYGIILTIGSSIISIHSTPKNRGIANSLHMATFGIGNITKMITTPIADVFGISTIFIVGGITAFSSALPVLLTKAKKAK